MSVTSKLVGVRARIRVRATSDGGRKTPIVSGYRASLFFPDDHPQGHDGVLQAAQQVFPGAEADVQIPLLCPELIEDWVRPGSTFEIREGPRMVAAGAVTDLLTVDETDPPFAERKRARQRAGNISRARLRETWERHNVPTTYAAGQRIEKASGRRPEEPRAPKQ